jgi:mannose-6-phosphate isomerase-like protein (cupin superfamily)
MTRDLVTGLDHRRYWFTELRLAPGVALRPDDAKQLCTYLVIAGTVQMNGREYRRLDGWHAEPHAGMKLRNDGSDPAVLLTAGALDGDPRPDTARILKLSDYTVAKPWGEEQWYTQNLTDPGYALKRISMRAGHQSSLQSHQWKCETNYVIEGRATVLGGSPAPVDLTGTVDVRSLDVQPYEVGTGWTSAPNVLHRVVAEVDYTAIEVSTPELDDVIRWADDSGRSHGRISSEHGETAS